MSETLLQKQVRLVLEKQCRELADGLKARVPAGVGFLLFLADFGERGNSAYVATVERQSAIKMVQEWLDVQDANHPEEGWETAALFVMQCAEVLGCAADPAVVLERCRELAAKEPQ